MKPRVSRLQTRRRSSIEAKNDADSILYSSEKTLDEYKDKIAAEDKEAIETAIKELREAVEAEDLGKLRRRRTPCKVRQ